MQIIIQNYNDTLHEHQNQTKYYHYGPLLCNPPWRVFYPLTKNKITLSPGPMVHFFNHYFYLVTCQVDCFILVIPS